MRDPRKFQLTSGPRGKYVYHRSPSGRKVTRNVPNNVTTKEQAVRFLASTNGRGYVRTSAPGPKFMVFGGRRVALTPARPANALDCKALSKLSGLHKIGSGRQGVIFAARRAPHHFIKNIAIKVAPFDKAAERRGEKQPSEVEWEIMEKVRKVAQGGVVQSLEFHHCKDFVAASNMNNINKVNKNIDPHQQSVLFMTFADEGTLNKWISSRAGRLKDDELLSIINKVLITLHRIMKAYPEFRHNDLYLENVLMNNGEPKIADFGWARIAKTGTNPAVNTALANGTAAKFGIGPNTSSRYDMHLFLNEIRRLLRRIGGAPRTMAFLDRCIPVGFREFDDVYTREGRLKYGMPLPGLPTIREILKFPEMKWNRGTPSPTRPKPKSASPPKPRSPPKRASPRRNFSNNNFLKMSPRTFLALTPSTRARATAARKAAAKGKAPTRNNKPRANAATNATAKRRASPPRAPVASNVRISPRTLKSNKFNRLVTRFLNLTGSAPYQNRWNAARNKAIQAVENRLRAGKPAFSASPRPAPSPPRVVKSSGSGRFKVVGPSGRLVYADGASVTMNFLRNLASRKGVNTKGLRSKEAIARAIFNRN